VLDYCGNSRYLYPWAPSHLIVCLCVFIVLTWVRVLVTKNQPQPRPRLHRTSNSILYLSIGGTPVVCRRETVLVISSKMLGSLRRSCIFAGQNLLPDFVKYSSPGVAAVCAQTHLFENKKGCQLNFHTDTKYQSYRWAILEVTFRVVRILSYRNRLPSFAPR